MDIVFSDTDIKNLINKSLNKQGYHVMKINKGINEYIATVQSVEERLSDIMSNRKKNRY